MGGLYVYIVVVVVAANQSDSDSIHSDQPDLITGQRSSADVASFAVQIRLDPLESLRNLLLSIVIFWMSLGTLTVSVAQFVLAHPLGTVCVVLCFLIVAIFQLEHV